MPWPWKIPDDEFVRRVERYQRRWRGPVAVFMVAASVAYIGLALYFYRLICSGLYPFFEDEIRQSSFHVGVMVGYIGGSLFFGALFSLIAGLYIFFARRKDQVLVTYYRRSERGERGDQPT
jgi:hypothetical protein